MLTTSEYKKVFETLAASHRSCIIVVGGDSHRLPMNGAALETCGGNGHRLLPQTDPRIEKILYRTETETRTVGSVQFNGNGNGKYRIIFFKPVSLEGSLRSRIKDYALTRREQEIALWVMRGLSNREVAEKCFICEQTVKDHLRVIFQRMHVRRRSELLVKLLMHAVDVRIPPPPPNQQSTWPLTDRLTQFHSFSLPC